MDATPRRDDGDTVPVLEEQLRIVAQERVTGVVRVRKTVVLEEQDLPLPPTRRVEIDVERVPVGRVVDRPAATRTEGDLTIVPVHEERWVLVRELVLVEELHLRRRHRTEAMPPRRVTTRRQQATVERVAAASEPVSPSPDAADAVPDPPTPDPRTPTP